MLFAGAIMAQPDMKFSENTHDFGEIEEGKLASHEFKFINVGNLPLSIIKVMPVCGWISTEWTKDPIMPGKGGSIKAVYNSEGHPGVFGKQIIIRLNFGGFEHLYVNGSVIKKAEKVTTEEQNSPKIALTRSLVLDTIVIGNKVWMAKNLDTDRYANGDTIPLIRIDNEWVVSNEMNKIGASCFYDNNPDNNSKYGKLAVQLVCNY